MVTNLTLYYKFRTSSLNDLVNDISNIENGRKYIKTHPTLNKQFKNGPLFYSY